MPPPVRGSIAIAIALAAGLVSVAVPAQAATSISDRYVRTSSGESLSAFFQDADGTTTEGRYSGLVEVIVSGVGQSFGTRYTDAFYYVSSGPGFTAGMPTGAGFYELALTADGSAPLNSTGSRIAPHIVFVEGMGEVSGKLPAYSDDHVYRFVVDLAAFNDGKAGHLTFGVNDGRYNDNSGRFDITLFQLRNAVPEPATWAMMIAGFGLVGAAMRRRRVEGMLA